MKTLKFISFFLFINLAFTQDKKVIYDIINEISADRIRKRCK